ncbi:programmed cell death protein 2-like isoform X3 [Phascolarctos cinereus]|uniref:Programmed cell death protein 2-like isoform X2 n=1 Tax=Phascolarctos cinereus TaxID=38626 RepID=A0A6P5K6Y7_PHACI|nr:programmed cell death protein 2-like isoform X2 [Phascolarctos cinereus]
MAAAATTVLLGLRDAEMRGNFEDFQDGAWAINKMGGVPPAHSPRPPAGLCALRGCHGARRPSLLPSGRLALPPSAARVRLCPLGLRGPAGQKEENNFAVKDWCEGAEDWGDDSESNRAPWITSDLLDSDIGDNVNVDEDRECMSQLQELTLDEALSDSHSFGHTIPAREGHVLPSSSVPVFQPYYINVVDEEDYTNFVDTNHAQKLLQEYRQREGIELDLLIAQSFIFDNGEKYEKAVSKSNDKIFYKFMKRISACREQILRYSWNGQPLFITCPSSDATGIPSCSNCGSCRVFEFQLMPALVSMLKNTLLDISVEFGTVLIYTCQKSCWPANHQNPVEEFCVIQEDPDQMLFK